MLRLNLPRQLLAHLYLGLCLLWFSPEAVMAAGAQSLAGSWRFKLDRADLGIQQSWFARRLEAKIRLPGSLSEQGIGDPISIDTPWTGGIVDRSFFTAPEFARYRVPGQVKVPFWLQPETYYAGAAWYQRE